MKPHGPPLPGGRRAWRTPASQRRRAAEGVAAPKLDGLVSIQPADTLAPGFTSGPQRLNRQSASSALNASHCCSPLRDDDVVHVNSTRRGALQFGFGAIGRKRKPSPASKRHESGGFALPLGGGFARLSLGLRPGTALQIGSRPTRRASSLPTSRRRSPQTCLRKPARSNTSVRHRRGEPRLGVRAKGARKGIFGAATLPVFVPVHKRADGPQGKNAGIRVGRLAVRTRGSLNPVPHRPSPINWTHSSPRAERRGGVRRVGLTR